MYRGSIVAIVTPMKVDGSLDFPALKRLVDFHVDNGTHAIVSVGTTGESPTVTPDEHIEVMKHTVEYASGRIPVIGGTGSNSTAEAVYFTKEAATLGVDACLQVVPYYNKPTQGGLYQHFRTIAEAVTLPQVLYNVPGRTSCDLLTETVDRLADIDNIVAIKDASGDLERARELVETCADRMDILTGEDANTTEHMRLGGKGTISVTANVAPGTMRQMCEAGLAGDVEKARALNDKLADLHRALFLEANPIPVKWALGQMGLIESGIRLPLTPLSDSYHDQVRAAMHKAEIL